MTPLRQPTDLVGIGYWADIPAHAMQSHVDLQEHPDLEVTAAVQYYPPTSLPLSDDLSVWKNVELARPPSLPGVHIEEPCRSPRKRTKVAQASIRRTDAQRKVNEPKARWMSCQEAVGGGGSQPELANYHRSTWESFTSLLHFLGSGAIKSLDQGKSGKVALRDLRSVGKRLNYNLPTRGQVVEDWRRSMMRCRDTETLNVHFLSAWLGNLGLRPGYL